VSDPAVSNGIPPGCYAVRVADPQGGEVLWLIHEAEVRQAVAGPAEPHAKAAFLASLAMQAHADAGKLPVQPPLGGTP